MINTTSKKLHQIVNELICNKPDEKLVISSIAKIAGISNSTIHNRHPDVLDKILAHNAKFIKKSTNSKNEQIIRLKAEKKQLQERIKNLEEQNRRLVSINAVYELQLK